MKTNKLPAGLVVAVYLFILVFFLSRRSGQIPSALVSSAAFLGVQFFFPACRFSFKRPLVPSNIAQALFAIQLVVIPFLILTSGVAAGQLPTLPSHLAINVGLLISSLAYVAYALAYSHAIRRGAPKGSRALQSSRYPLRHAYGLAAVFLILGLVGYYLFSGSLRAYLSYIGFSSYRLSLGQSMATGLAGPFSTFLRPFLGFAIVLGWCLWVDRHRPLSRGLLLFALTVLTALLLVFVNLGFQYNRGAVAGPLFALGAAFTLRVRRVPAWALALIGIAIIGGLIILRPYRQSDLGIADLTSRGQVQELLANYSLADDIQVYGGAPQFLGFLIEETGWGLRPYWGRTLLASILYPLPGWGKRFRPDSGVALYNNLIYRDPRVMDQVVPFSGELFINFHIVGVLAGFALLGAIMARLQSAFFRSQNTFEAYTVFLVSAWVAFLIPGSIAVTCQIFVYALWPVYLYWAVRRLRQARGPRRVTPLAGARMAR